MKLRITKAAGSDMRSIRRYTLKTWGAEQEQKYIDQLWDKIQAISENPSRHRLRNDLFPGCRSAREGKHVILFQVADDTLTIVRVLHTAMDIPRQLND